MKLDVVYCTYRKDLCWVAYSAQLLHKNLKADFRTIIIGEPDCEEIFKTWGLVATTYHYVKPWPDGYMFAMYTKMMADRYSDADMIMVLDSDHILLRPVSLDQFMQGGLPVIRYKHWTEDPSDPSLVEGYRQWAPPTERLLGVALDRDYMRGPPFLFWRDTFLKTRLRIEEVTGLPFMDAVYSDRPYDYRQFLSHPKTNCDYEVLGCYATKFQPGRYALAHDNGEPWPFRVYWSHGDWSQYMEGELAALLRRPEPFNGDVFVQPEIESLIERHDIETIVETGSGDYSTTRAMAELRPVITIEMDPELYAKGSGLIGVRRNLGDSAEILPDLFPLLEPILFFLDAHGGGQKHSPLLEELAIIAENCEQKPVIVIHDFENPARPEFGFDTWDCGPYTFELIRQPLNKIYGADGYRYHYNSQACGQRRGIIYIEPV